MYDLPSQRLLVCGRVILPVLLCRFSDHVSNASCGPLAVSLRCRAGIGSHEEPVASAGTNRVVEVLLQLLPPRRLSSPSPRCHCRYVYLDSPCLCCCQPMFPEG